MIGKCHCGRVVFEVKRDLPTRGARCNCSYCSRRGWIAGVASVDEFELVEGDGFLEYYQFGGGTSYNYFCGVCGVHTHFYNTYDDPHDYKYNLACCEDVDLENLEITHIDGKSF